MEKKCKLDLIYVLNMLIELCKNLAEQPRAYKVCNSIRLSVDDDLVWPRHTQWLGVRWNSKKFS